MKKEKSKKQPSLTPFFAYWRGVIEERYLTILKPAGRFLTGLGVEPDLMTFVGCLFGALAGLVYAHGAFFWAAWLVLIAALCHTLDGLMARLTHKQSAHAVFLSSITECCSDIFIFLGMAYFFASNETLYAFMSSSDLKASPWPVVWTVLALSGSFLVSYARARAEGLELECKVGIMQYPERVILLVLSSWLSALPRHGLLIFKIALVLIAILSHFTALQRILYIHKRLLARSK